MREYKQRNNNAISLKKRRWIWIVSILSFATSFVLTCVIRPIVGEICCSGLLEWINNTVIAVSCGLVSGIVVYSYSYSHESDVLRIKKDYVVIRKLIGVLKNKSQELDELRKKIEESYDEDEISTIIIDLNEVSDIVDNELIYGISEKTFENIFDDYPIYEKINKIEDLYIIDDLESDENILKELIELYGEEINYYITFLTPVYEELSSELERLK